MYDGPPSELTLAAMREIYQVGPDEADLAEEITSTTGWLNPEPAFAAA